MGLNKWNLEIRVGREALILSLIHIYHLLGFKIVTEYTKREPCLNIKLMQYVARKTRLVIYK